MARIAGDRSPVAAAGRMLSVYEAGRENGDPGPIRTGDLPLRRGKIQRKSLITNKQKRVGTRIFLLLLSLDCPRVSGRFSACLCVTQTLSLLWPFREVIRQL